MTLWAAQNTLNLLDLFGENHIPVFRGAVDFILEACDEYQENLTLVATGPLTNLAACIDQDFDRFKQVGKIVVMGGALTVTGSVTPFSETNMGHDPRAADRVFQSGRTETGRYRRLLYPSLSKR